VSRPKRRLAVVFGGRSAEHEISVISARAVLEALDAERYDVLTIGIDKQGRWHRLPALPSAVAGRLPAVALESGGEVALSREPGDAALVADDGYSVAKLAHLMQRLGAAECMQWRLRRRPLGVEDWRTIAGEDTGSMFETCACLGTRDDRLRRFGQLLGTLYHGCDDVADVRGTAALGGGSEKDILDGILTLPAAIAVRDPVVAALFERREPETIPLLTEKLASALPEAERYLDRIAGEAEAEARANAAHPEGLLELIGHTRALSAA